MKKLLITFHMTNATEGAETCVTLPMSDYVAHDILTWGEDSSYIRYGGTVHTVLKAMAQLQGYQYDCFCTAEEVK